MPLTRPSVAIGAFAAATLPGASANWIGTSYGTAAGFVVVAYNTNRAAVSTDGITWSSGTLPATRLWYGVTYGDSGYLAIADGTATAATSTDGLTWSNATLPSAQAWRNPYFKNGLYFVSGNSALYYSTDTVTWGTATGYAGGGVEYGAGLWVGPTASSTDGKTWTPRTAAAPTAGRIKWGNNIFLCTSSSGGNSTAAQTSTDGITWTLRTLPSSTTWYGLGFGNGYFVVTNLSNVAAITTDGVSWQTRTSAVSGSHNYDNPFGANKVLSAIQNSTSVDFITLGQPSPQPVTTGVYRAASW